MKKVYIIHGWGESPDEPLHKWFASQLEKEGFEVQVPAMPNTDEPKIETWVPFLQELVDMPDLNTFFIGHSIGCQAILRFLETLPEDTKIGGAVFIAGWYNVRNLETEEEWKIVRPWVDTPGDDEKVKRVVNRAVVILSDNDPFVAPENQESWKKKIGATIIIEHGKGHFTEDDGVKSLPSALQAILEMR
ncbi:MAG: alpha/beta hydrolase [Patescibacteria group bacterium]